MNTNEIQKPLTIGQLSKQTQTPQTTIRYYERRGLLMPSERSQNGYRLYHQDAIDTLSFIKKAQLLDFTLDEIKQLIELQSNHSTSCSEIKKVTEQKIKIIHQKIRTLQAIEGQLQSLSEKCPVEKSITKCPVIKHIARLS